MSGLLLSLIDNCMVGGECWEGSGSKGRRGQKRRKDRGTEGAIKERTIINPSLQKTWPFGFMTPNKNWLLTLNVNHDDQGSLIALKKKALCTFF